MNPNSELDIDWTLAPGNWHRELALREHRNILIRDHLQRGMTVAYRTSSTSTTSATSNPSWSAVEPGWRYYSHFIKKIEWRWHQGKIDRCFTIANQQGRESGWCWSHMIWGKLCQINDRPYQVE